MRIFWLIKFLAALVTLMLVAACVPTNPVVDYTPEQLSSLQITLEGKGAIRAGTYNDNINDLIWTCPKETPLQLTVDVDDMKASLKLKVFGRYYRASAPVNKYGEVKASIGFVSYGAITEKYNFNTEVQLRYQRARITFNKGSSLLVGCPSGWFDLAEKEHETIPIRMFNAIDRGPRWAGVVSGGGCNSFSIEISIDKDGVIVGKATDTSWGILWDVKGVVGESGLVYIQLDTYDPKHKPLLAQGYSPRRLFMEGLLTGSNLTIAQTSSVHCDPPRIGVLKRL